MNPHEHILHSVDEEQQRLKGALLRMGGMAADQLVAALHAVDARDDAAARRVAEADAAIDRLEQDTSQDAMKLALRGPMARDLREILAAIRIASDLERIGDYGANVAKRSLVLNTLPPLPQTGGLAMLGELAARQVRRVMDAYRDNDAGVARAVRDDDAAIDRQYTGLFRELLTHMMEDPRNITGCTHLLFMAKNIERIGDHATNIAENVLFLLTGDDALPPREKRDTTMAP